MAWAATLPVRAAGEDATFPVPSLLLFQETLLGSLKLGTEVTPERRNPAPPPYSPRCVTVPLRTTLGREHEARAGAHLCLVSREEASPRFIPLPFQPPMPTPSPFRSSRVVFLDHRPPKLLEL